VTAPDEAALREAVRAAVTARTPIDDAERDSIATFLRHLDELAHPFDEHADPVHVTGSAFVVGPRGVVLLHHKRMGMWLQPGGHIDPGETPWDGALREATEETGLACRFADDPPRLVHADVHPGPRGHLHLDLRYLVDGGDADPQPPEGESQLVGWFHWDAAIELAGDPRLSAALRSIRPG
jgi:8-oxo-dGTP pyrophosphatase MutT (NUDIX family)